ncbi:MAG: transcription antiterminator, partial [Planifilum fimeticola]
MALDQRSCSVLHYLARSEGTVAIPLLTETFRVSRRTIYYDLDKIDDWLKKQGFSPMKRIRGSGVVLEEAERGSVREAIQNLRERDYEYGTAERQSWMVLHLMTAGRPVFIEDFTRLFRVSRNTVIEDIKALKHRLRSFRVSLISDRKRGYCIEGEEKDCRRGMLEHLSGLFPEDAWPLLETNKQNLFRQGRAFGFPSFPPHLFDDVAELIQEEEKRYGVEYTDAVHLQLTLRLLFLLRRIQLGRRVRLDPVEKGVLRDAPERDMAQTLMEKISKLFSVSVPGDEIDYLTSHLLGARINKLGTESDSEDLQRLSGVIRRMIDDFEKRALVRFPDREAMEHNMLIHLKSAYYRLMYDIPVNNPVAGQVMERYPEIYQITEQVIHHLEAIVHKPVPKSEIAFMAMHFGGWLRRGGLTVRRKPRVLIVCAGGVGTSRMLQQQLEERFPSMEILRTATIRHYRRYQDQADVILSTAPLEPAPPVPVMTVSPILTGAQLAELQRKLGLEEAHPRAPSPEALLRVVEQYAEIRDRAGLERALGRLFHPSERPLPSKPGLEDLLSGE